MIPSPSLTLAALLLAVSAAQQPAPPNGSASSSAATAVTGDEEEGRAVFAANCRSCHSGAIAPSLSGVVGRPVASFAGYAYSEGLKAKASLSWTPEHLNTFLTAPQAFAPGTRMPKSLNEPQERADVIAYLKSLSAE